MPVSRRRSGGLHDFVDSGELKPLEEDRKNAVKKGYQEYKERKARERKIKIALIVVVVLIVIFTVASLFFL